MTDANQIKSRQRVQDHGEVFTNPREVNAMLDLVKQETERIDSRFLEPACGDGNFLVEILRRKLAVVHRQYRRSALDFEKYSLLALSSIYGVELLPDNAARCRERLFQIWDEAYTAVCKKSRLAQACREAAHYLLERNIICGDALTMETETGEALVFSQWSLIGSRFKRADYSLNGLLKAQPPQPDQVPLPEAPRAQQQQSMLRKEPLVEQTSLLDQFHLTAQNPDNKQEEPASTQPETDEEGRLLHEYPLTDYWRIAHEHQPLARPGL